LTHQRVIGPKHGLFPQIMCNLSCSSQNLVHLIDARLIISDITGISEKNTIL